MKKLIIILFFAAFSMNAQDKVNHLSAGTMIGFAGNGGSYLLLTKTTKLKPKTCKWISFAAGFGLGVFAGHLKETHDMNGGFYNKKDLRITALGAALGSFSFKLIIGKSIPESRVPKEDIYDIENLPLVKNNPLGGNK
jgi:hypothetical protein